MTLPRPPSAQTYLLVLPVAPVLLEGLVVLEGLELDGVVLPALLLPDESVELEPDPVDEPVVELPEPDVPEELLSVLVVPDPEEPDDEP